MKVFLGADHRGFKLKEQVKKELKEQGYAVVDVGAPDYDRGDDYIDFVLSLVRVLSAEDRGILFCGSGHGMDMAANRFGKVRAVLCWRKELAQQGREHEDANVLVVPADWLEQREAEEMVKVFLETGFSGGKRHRRRLKKLEKIADTRV